MRYEKAFPLIMICTADAFSVEIKYTIMVYKTYHESQIEPHV